MTDSELDSGEVTRLLHAAHGGEADARDRAHVAVRVFSAPVFPLNSSVNVRREAGDTAGAIRAYRRFLRIRGDAEPRLQPQVDSVRAALAAVERGTR